MPGALAIGPLAFPRMRGVPGLIQRGALDHSSGIFPTVSWNYTLTPTVGGNIYSRPKFTITLGAVNDYGVTQIQIVNTSVLDANGNYPYTITVPYAYLPGDVLTIDSDPGTVRLARLGTAQIDFSGQFPLLDPRAGTTNTVIIYVLAKNAPTLAPVMTWPPRWLS